MRDQAPWSFQRQRKASPPPSSRQEKVPSPFPVLCHQSLHASQAMKIQHIIWSQYRHLWLQDKTQADRASHGSWVAGLARQAWVNVCEPSAAGPPCCLLLACWMIFTVYWFLNYSTASISHSFTLALPLCPCCLSVSFVPLSWWCGLNSV